MGGTATKERVSISMEEQVRRHADALSQCMEQKNATTPTTDVYCPSIFDTIACWPLTPAGEVAQQPCPNYVPNFLIHEWATKRCMKDGTWYADPMQNTSWTNYSACTGQLSSDGGVSKVIRSHMPHIQMLSNVGYGISLVSLVVAVFIMLYFKKLHCARNTLHLNLFLTFILRSVVSFLKENLMVEGLGLPQDVLRDDNDNLIFAPNGTHWECKLLYTVHMYIIGANCSWIFVEGLYLHMLIFMAVFSENSNIARYIVIGWFSPLIFIVPWVIVRSLLDDHACWHLYMNKDYFWIIRGPITLTMLVNFLFFLNIVRVLFTKMQATSGAHVDRANRYRKLAKSTLVLIPLFGIHYIVFIWIDPSYASATTEVIWLYFEMFFNSFQGLFIALLFCFVNGEVQAEFKKKWQRYKLRKGDTNFSMQVRERSFANTSTTYVCRDDRHGAHDYKVYTEDANDGLVANHVDNSAGGQKQRGRKWAEQPLAEIPENPDK